MEQNRYFLGLDGGGTKTHCAIYDIGTDRLAFHAGGSTNHEALAGGFDALGAALDACMQPALDEMGIRRDALAYACFGMAGVDAAMERDAIAQILSDVGFSRFTLVNDGYLGVKTELDGQGVAAVNGTGYSVVGVNRAGEMLQIGGQGYMTGDRGGSAYLVPCAVSAAYGQLYKDEPKTALTALIAEWLEESDPDAFRDALTRRFLTDPGDAFISLTRILYRACAAGDDVARRILIDSGADYARSIRAVAKRLKLTEPIDVVLLGSNFTRCTDACAIDAMRRLLGEAYRLRVIAHPPVTGALLWAMERANIPLDERLRERVKRRVRHAVRAL